MKFRSMGKLFIRNNYFLRSIANYDSYSTNVISLGRRTEIKKLCCLENDLNLVPVLKSLNIKPLKDMQTGTMLLLFVKISKEIDTNC